MDTAALRRVLGSRRFSTDVERVLFSLFPNRVVDPASKLAAAEWASYDVAIPGLDGMNEDQCRSQSGESAGPTGARARP